MDGKQIRYGLTHPQQRVWYTEKLHPGTGMWNNAGTLKIRGTLDYTLLARAVNLFIEENESIRLRFGIDGSEPYQYIQPYAPYEVDVLDFAGRGIEKLYEWDSMQTQAPMPILGCDLFYIALIKIGENEGGMYAKFHHLISDGLSIVEFSNQVMTSYAQLLRGEVHTSAVTRSYIDYIADERAYMQSKRFEYDKKFWNEQFENLPEPTVIKQKKTNDFSIKAERKVGILHGQDAHDIRVFCQDAEISTFSLFLSALAIYINRITGKNDIIIGAPVVNRTSKNAKGTFGMFVSTVPIRIRIDDDLTFTEFAQVVSGQWFSALKHQRYPYNVLMQDLRRRHQNLESLFDVTLSYQIGTLAKDFTQFTYEGRWHFPGYQAVPLAIHVNDREDDGRFIIDYDHHSPFFSAKEIDYYHAHLMNIVRDIIHYPEKPLYALDLLTREERERILYRFNDTNVAYPEKGTLADLWYETAGRMPAGATAVICGGEEMSYGELDARSSALAHHLIKKNIGRGDIVALIVPRTMDYVVGALAVIKAGAAYLPIDSELPDERISYMISDSRAKAVLCGHGLAHKCPEAENLTVIKTSIPLALPVDPYIRPRCTSGDLAYVIYTSGSTGQPKGVQISHASIVHFVHSMDGIWDFSPGARLLGAASISFDISVMEIVLAMSYGAVLVLAQEHEVNIPRNMVQLIQSAQVNMLCVTPGRMELLLSDMQGAACLRDFREIGMGGDVLSEKLLARAQQSTGARITNFYGPTEITICCTCTDVTNTKIPNIGSPMPNVKAYILDTHQNPVPIGVPGELYVGGKGVARGYIGKSELNAERFIDNPFGEGRLYRTGDLTRWYPLGEIEFLGRIDKQVKIRGYRIELGEVENALLRLRGVTSCAVADHADAMGRRFLCAYLCGQVPGMADIKAQLTRELPGYMIPSYFMTLGELPHNASGKVNRSALPDPLTELVSTARDNYDPPQTDTEKALAEIWRSVLGIGEIGRGDSFFDIGGDSLSIVAVMAQIPQRFHVDIMLEDVYRNPQLSAFASLIDAAERCAYRPIVPAPIHADYPVSSSQQRMWVLQQDDKKSIAYNIPMAFALKGRVDYNALQAAFTALVSRHDALRTMFVLNGGKLRQKIMPSVPFAMERIWAEKEHLNETLVSQIKPFDMSRAPLMRAVAVETDDMTVLFIDLHHGIADRRSAEVLMRDLAALYTDTALPPKPYEYKDYAVWQRDFLESESITLQREYWQTAMAEQLPLLNLHTDRPRPAKQQHDGARISFDIDAKTANTLRRFAQQRGGTLFMAVLAVYNVLLARYTGQEDIIVGTPVSGRSRREVQDIVGVFINTLPMRSFPRGEMSFDEFFSELTERSVSAFAHADYPLERIVSDLKLPRDASRNPLFDTMLVMTAAPHTLALGEVQASHYPLSHGIAKLDLTLEVFEAQDGLHCEFEYATALWNESTIRRMAGHLKRLMHLLPAEPDTRIRDAAMMTQDELLQVTLGFNQTDAPLPDISVQSLLEDLAASNGGKTALICDGKQMTFSVLNNRANQIAHRLKQMGVGRNTIVALCIRRSFDMVAGLFGILKAGGGYLPLDPTYPLGRVSFMLTDSNTRVLLTDGTADIAFDGDVLHIQDVADAGRYENPERVDSQEDAAYVIYTSGSTGIPKGAILPRRALLNLYEGTKPTIQYDPDQTSISVTTVSFDIFVIDALLPLLFGCTVALCTEEELRQPHLAARLIESADVKFIQTTPTRMRLMMDDERFRVAAGRHIEKIVLGGEEFPLSLLKLLKKYTNARIISGYGPTETTVYCTFKDLTHTSHITIGRPIVNTRMYILDKNRRPVPIGVLGEAYISGACVATGYIGRDELNKQKYIPDPYWPGHVMYQSGDICAFMENGEMEIAGRVDHQVKIRGLRIELGEIEAAMRAIDGIDEAVVKDWGKGADRYLAVYYAVSCDLEEQTLRNMLGKTLPSYMIPSYFIGMKALPTTLNGKVDRKALTEPDRKQRQGSGNARLTPTERKMSRIWSEVLGVEGIGPDDNFFELGGDSLAVIKVQAAVLQYGWTIRTRDFYEQQTLGAVTACIGAEYEHETDDAVAHWLGVRIPEYKHLKRVDMEQVLLTGATGFLGAHVLALLAKRSNVRINCVVRAGDKVSAAKRLRETLTLYFGVKACREILAKTRVYCGDIAEPDFGFDAEALLAMTRIDTVIHTAAITDHVGQADAFYRANVLGTENAVAMAQMADAALLHVSTISVSGTRYTADDTQKGEFGETDYYVGQNYADNDYVKSKFLAEEAVLDAVARGLNARILRVGNLSATSDGRFQKNPERNAFANRIRALTGIGFVPVGMLDAHVEMTPVDACAAAILALADIEAPTQAVYHVYNTNTMTLGVLVSLLELTGHRIEIISDKTFLEMMNKLSRQGEYTYLKSLVQDVGEYGQPPQITVSANATVRLLSGQGFTWPVIDEQYMSQYLASIEAERKQGEGQA